jgi:hypothetical protein
LTIADTTLEYDTDLSVGWYLGGHDMPLQAILPKFFKSFSDNLNLFNRIYVGGSAGGFASLFYSFQDELSACIAVNPQIDILKYNKTSINKYLKAAWPNNSSFESISNYVVLDLSVIYNTNFKNFIIYLQSAGDMHHFGVHLSKLMHASRNSTNNFILNSGYWGIPGHSSSVPRFVLLSWLRALISASWRDRQDILDLYNKIASPHLGQSDSVRNSKDIFLTSDLLMANSLANFHLNQDL